MALWLLSRPARAREQLGVYDSLAQLLGPLRHGLTRPGRLLGGGLPAFSTDAAHEGRLAVAALEPRFNARLCGGLGLVKDSDLTAAFKGRSAAEWEEWAVDRDLPIVAVMD